MELFWFIYKQNWLCLRRLLASTAISSVTDINFLMLGVGLFMRFSKTAEEVPLQQSLLRT